MLENFRTILAIIVLLNLFAAHAHADTEHYANEEAWVSRGALGDTKIHLYFFWSKKCPHCLLALPYVKQLQRDHDWLILHSLEVSQYPKNAMQYRQMSSYLYQEARSVPGFLFCETMQTGYDSRGSMGRNILKDLKSCHQHMQSGGNLQTFREALLADASRRPTLDIPMLGTIDLGEYSLPLLTVTIAAMDAFNPCAFFILLFLLTMLVHARSRIRILMIGGVFVFISGAMYFLFMAAWLNVFLMVGQLDWMTKIAGLLAVLIAVINIKDYFFFKQGVSLTLSEDSRSGLFKRMRDMLSSRSTVAMVLGAVTLAVFANLYEFLCTAGFPMIFTRILTLEQLSLTQYYLYLLLYNLVYIIPLAVIVIVFTLTLGKRKLQEHEGRIMKLLSGTMMVSLGAVLLLAPQWLQQIKTSAFILMFAITSTIVVVFVDRYLNKHRV